jgi:hypothetical protein
MVTRIYALLCDQLSSGAPSASRPHPVIERDSPSNARRGLAYAADFLLSELPAGVRRDLLHRRSGTGSQCHARTDTARGVALPFWQDRFGILQHVRVHHQYVIR